MVDQLHRVDPVLEEDENVILDIEDLFLPRKKVRIAGQVFEMKGGEEFDLEGTVAIMRHARTLALLQRMDALTKAEQRQIESAASDTLLLGFPDMDDEYLSRVPFSVKLGLSQVFIENFTGALNRVQGTYRRDEPIPDMAVLADQLEELTSES